MSNYVKIVDFQAKDALLTGNPAKIIKGVEINDEFNAIQTAVATKADLASPAFTGNPTAATQATGNSSSRLATTAFVGTAISNGLATLGTISTQDANAVAITGGSITGLTSLTIPSAAIATTQAVGDSSLAVATTEFVNAEIANDVLSLFLGSNQSLGSSGYQKFPGGLIIQWGQAGSIGVDSKVTVTFPIPFPTACIGGFANNQSNATSGNTNLNAGTRAYTTSTMEVVNDGVTAGNHNWLALGY
jgi:hypothetical protein